MWMSDESFSPTVFRCLPASVAMQMTDTGIVPQGSQAALKRSIHHLNLNSCMCMATTDFRLNVASHADVIRAMAAGWRRSFRVCL